MSKMTRDTKKAVNTEAKRPMSSVTANPLIGPVPNWKRNSAEMMVVMWVSMIVPYTYVYDTHGDKARTVQFSAAGIIGPTSLFFTRSGHILVTPGCYEFRIPR